LTDTNQIQYITCMQSGLRVTSNYIEYSLLMFNIAHLQSIVVKPATLSCVKLLS